MRRRVMPEASGYSTRVATTHLDAHTTVRGGAPAIRWQHRSNAVKWRSSQHREPVAFDGGLQS